MEAKETHSGRGGEKSFPAHISIFFSSAQKPIATSHECTENLLPFFFSQTSLKNICSAKHFSYNNHSLLDIACIISCFFSVHCLMCPCVHLYCNSLKEKEKFSLCSVCCLGTPTTELHLHLCPV